MISFTAGSKAFEAELFVFDKDGLMFDSVLFWRELANKRCEVIARVCESTETAIRWAQLMGTDTRFCGDTAETSYVDPLGVMAVASPYEERTVTAGLLSDIYGWKWHTARDKAIEIFSTADRELDLKKAIVPQPGYQQLFDRLIEMNVPYAVATSDTLDRTRDSMGLFGHFSHVRYVVTPEDVAEGKPAPDMLLLMSQKSGVPISKIAMVGDSYVDVKMANAAGAIGIGVTRDPEMKQKMEPYASAIIETLNEICLQ